MKRLAGVRWIALLGLLAAGDVAGAVAGLRLSLDAPAAGIVVQPFTLAGWALDDSASAGTGVDAVHVWAWPSQGGAPIWIGDRYGGRRDDVAAVFGGRFADSGYDHVVSGLPAGTYTFVVYARSAVTGVVAQRAVRVAVEASEQMALDVPVTGAMLTQPFTVGGWAVDRAAPAGAGVDAVHVWAYPASGGAVLWVGADYGRARPDVAAALGEARFGASGFQITARDLPPGAYRLVASARSVVSQAFTAQRFADVTVGASAEMALDRPAADATLFQPFAISGWAVDRGSSHGTGIDAVHVWAYPAGGGTPRWVGADYGQARPDVAAVFNDARFAPSGFQVVSTQLPPGRYRLVVGGRSRVSGAFDAIRSADVTVAPLVTLAGAGDIGVCGLGGAAATGDLLASLAPTVVFTAGDNAYPNGTAAEFSACYDPFWGRHKALTRPSPGNHDYHSAGAAPYFAYYGANAGPSGTGYYSYTAGRWHVVSLNSEIDASAGSAQEQWLRADLAAANTPCTAAYWHRPRFSSGPHGDAVAMGDLWQALYDNRADLVINGHDHTYERFAAQAPDGTADPARGIRQFVVGTGGAALYSFGAARANSEVRDNGSWGVLRLMLGEELYAWEFVGTDGVVRDSGLGACAR